MLRYIREESFKDIYVDMPTTFWAEQDRGGKEKKRTGIEIARRAGAQDLKDFDRYLGYAKGIIVLQIIVVLQYH